MSQLTNQIRVGHFAYSPKKYTGSKIPVFDKKLQFVWDDNLPKELRGQSLSIVYFFVVDGEICKIGQTGMKSGIKGCIQSYANAGFDDPFPNRFVMSCHIRELLDQGKTVEMYFQYEEPIEVEVKGLTTTHKMRVGLDAKYMERVCEEEYRNLYGRLPIWNYQETGTPFPEEFEALYTKYKTQNNLG